MPRLRNPYLPQNDRSDHRHDNQDHGHDQPDASVFPVSRVLPCLKGFIPRRSLCGPSGLLLLSRFLRLCHVLPLFSVRRGAVCTPVSH
jgi:hypothetical protein